VVDILAALKTNDRLQLQFLDLSGNCIFGPGAKGVAELLQDNRWAVMGALRFLERGGGRGGGAA
jgi:hypothetical protein